MCLCILFFGIFQIYKMAKKGLESGKVKELPLLVSSEKIYDYFGPKIWNNRRHFEDEKTLPGMTVILSSSYKYGILLEIVFDLSISI
jgi:hypothetical protein